MTLSMTLSLTFISVNHILEIKERHKGTSHDPVESNKLYSICTSTAATIKDLNIRHLATFPLATTALDISLF